MRVDVGVLLIGGSNDGSWLTKPQPDQDRISVPVKEDLKSERVTDPPKLFRRLDVEYYNRMVVGAGELVLSVFRHESLTEEDVMKLLIEHYTPQPFPLRTVIR